MRRRRRRRRRLSGGGRRPAAETLNIKKGNRKKKDGKKVEGKAKLVFRLPPPSCFLVFLFFFLGIRRFSDWILFWDGAKQNGEKISVLYSHQTKNYNFKNFFSSYSCNRFRESSVECFAFSLLSTTTAQWSLRSAAKRSPDMRRQPTNPALCCSTQSLFLCRKKRGKQKGFFNVQWRFFFTVGSKETLKGGSSHVSIRIKYPDVHKLKLPKGTVKSTSSIFFLHERNLVCTL